MNIVQKILIKVVNNQEKSINQITKQLYIAKPPSLTTLQF